MTRIHGFHFFEQEVTERTEIFNSFFGSVEFFAFLHFLRLLLLNQPERNMGLLRIDGHRKGGST